MAAEGQTTTLSGEILDPSPLDTFALDIAWGDGASDSLTFDATPISGGGVLWDPATRTFSVDHVYADNDAYAARLTITDDDGGLIESTTDSWSGTSAITSFGETDQFTPTATLGQTFNAGRSTDLRLDSFSFFVKGPETLDFEAFVMEWDGTKAVDPVLYQSTPQATTNSGDFEKFTFDTGGVILAADRSYVAFISASNLYDGINGLGVVGALSAGPFSDGMIVYARNGSDFESLSTTPWDRNVGEDLVFEAHFAEIIDHTVSVANFAPLVGHLAFQWPIEESQTATLNGQIFDDGVLDTFTLDVDWGDGDSQSIPLGATPLDSGGIVWEPATWSFSIDHVYQDNGDFSATVTVTDNDGDSFTTPAVMEPMSYEGGVHSGAQIQAWSPIGQSFVAQSPRIGTVGVFITDYNATIDDHSISIDLYAGEGAGGTLLATREVEAIPDGHYDFVEVDFSSVTLDVGSAYSIMLRNDTIRWGVPFSFTDAYAGGSMIKAGVPEPVDLGFRVLPLLPDMARPTVSVVNVAPVVGNLTLNGPIDEGQAATLTGKIADVSPQDTFTLDIDWGNGDTDSLLLDETPLNSGGVVWEPVTRTFSVDHVYGDNGDFDVNLTLTDDDGGSFVTPDVADAVGYEGGVHSGAQIQAWSPIGQSFVAQSPRIGTVGVFITDYNATIDDHSISIDLYAGEGAGGTLLATREVEAIPDGHYDFVEVDFSSVTLDVGSAYSIMLRNDTIRWGVPFSFTDAYAGGSMIKAGVPEPVDLGFRVLPSLPDMARREVTVENVRPCCTSSSNPCRSTKTASSRPRVMSSIRGPTIGRSPWTSRTARLPIPMTQRAKSCSCPTR